MHRELFRATALPVLQNKTFDSQEAARLAPTGDVILVQNSSTGLIYNSCFDEKKLSYDESYQNEQACSGVFKNHLDDVANIVTRYFQGKSLVEVGCGKGYFLDYLEKKGFEIVGVDPAYEGENQKVIKAPFAREMDIRADGVILRHVLEHISDPLSFLAEIAHANGGKGLIYIEVPCFDWIITHGAWFDIFYEHVNYFRMGDFSRIFGRVLNSGRIFGGQYLYVVADLSSLRIPKSSAKDNVAMPEYFISGIQRSVVMANSKPKSRNIIWGGASKGVVFAIYMQRAGVDIAAVVDINPAKQGRFLPVSALPVSAPTKIADDFSIDDNVFVMNSNYLDEIIAASKNKFSYITVDHG